MRLANKLFYHNIFLFAFFCISIQVPLNCLLSDNITSLSEVKSMLFLRLLSTCFHMAELIAP